MHAPELKLVSDSSLLPARQGSATLVERVDAPEHPSRGSAPEFVLLEDQQRFRAGRASSCLLEPAIGDRVWFVSEAGPAGQQRSYVIAVLERAPGDEPARLRIEGKAELRADQLTVVADQGLALRTSARLDLQGDELRVHSRLARVLLDECSMVLRSLFSHVGKATFIAKLLETLAERISVHSQTSQRSVEQLDQVRAGTIDYRAEQSASLGATHTLVSGGELVKVDGGQIHLG